MWMLVTQREDFIVGVGVVGRYIVAQHLKDKASGWSSSPARYANSSD